MSHLYRIPTLVLTLALAALGCASGYTDLDDLPPKGGKEADVEPDQGDADPEVPPGTAVTPEDLRLFRDQIRRQEEAAAANAKNDNIVRQQALAEKISKDLPDDVPTFATASARTVLAELSGDQILSKLGYSRISSHKVEGDKDVYDDGTLRLRVSRSVPGYFKFADRNLLDQAKGKYEAEATVSGEVIDRKAAAVLAELGVPSSEVGRIEARPVTLDTGDRYGAVNTYGTVAYVANVKRHVQDLSVLGSACTMAFDTGGRLTWTRCRWPQFRLAEDRTGAQGRPYQDVVARMAQQLDRAMPKSAAVTDFDLSSGFAYAERVTSTGVEYVPVLRVIVVGIEGGGAGEFLETVSGGPM